MSTHNAQVTDSARRLARGLARATGTFHNIAYYAPEMGTFAEVGLPEYWRAYVAYRSAPIGRAAPGAIGAMFFNFAPRVIAAALPSAWDEITPEEALERRDHAIDAALRRSLGEHLGSQLLREAADLARRGIADVDASARPLFAAHTELSWPETDHMTLWHACTLWREHRGDGHNIALAAAGIDGVECHVLLAARGIANKRTIEKIRGWTSDEWDAAVRRLADRGLVDPQGESTAAGLALRREIEDHTDRLAAEPRVRLGESGVSRLVALLEPVVAHLVDTGAVSGTWPPKKPPV